MYPSYLCLSNTYKGASQLSFDHCNMWYYRTRAIQAIQSVKINYGPENFEISQFQSSVSCFIFNICQSVLRIQWILYPSGSHIYFIMASSKISFAICRWHPQVLKLCIQSTFITSSLSYLWSISYVLGL